MRRPAERSRNYTDLAGGWEIKPFLAYRCAEGVPGK